jgi:hypothetical protein
MDELKNSRKPAVEYQNIKKPLAIAKSFFIDYVNYSAK